MSTMSTSDCLRNQMFFVKFFGLWETETLLNRIHSFVTHWIFLYTGSLLQLMYILSVDNFEDLSENFFVSAKFCTVAVKTFMFTLNVVEIRKFVKRFTAKTFQPRDQEEKDLLMNAFKFSSRLSLFFMSTVLSAASLVIILPVLEWKRRLPFLYWYPFDIDAFISNFFNFSWLFIFHSFSGWTAAGLDISIDALIYGLLTIVKYQLKMLGHRLKNANSKFIEGILIHRETLYMMRDFHRLFNGILFVQITQSVIVLSMTMLQLTLSMDLSTNAFLNDFRSFDRPTSKSFMFLLHNLQNSVIWVRAVGVFTFSLTFQTLVAILKTSYSYVVLMQTMADK